MTLELLRIDIREAWQHVYHFIILDTILIIVCHATSFENTNWGPIAFVSSIWRVASLPSSERRSQKKSERSTLSRRKQHATVFLSANTVERGPHSALVLYKECFIMRESRKADKKAALVVASGRTHRRIQYVGHLQYVIITHCGFDYFCIRWLSHFCVGTRRCINDSIASVESAVWAALCQSDVCSHISQ